MSCIHMLLKACICGIHTQSIASALSTCMQVARCLVCICICRHIAHSRCSMTFAVVPAHDRPYYSFWRAVPPTGSSNSVTFHGNRQRKVGLQHWWLNDADLICHCSDQTTGCRSEEHIIYHVKGYSSSTVCPDRLWAPFRYLIHEADLSPQFNAELKNTFSCTSTLHVWSWCDAKDIFTFVL
jgi:hypothetical protein